jgi:hypothetical protein
MIAHSTLAWIAASLAVSFAVGPLAAAPADPAPAPAAAPDQRLDAATAERFANLALA